jgi:MFS family permease
MASDPEPQVTSSGITMSSIGRWQIVMMLMGFAALGHFNRVGISVVGSEVFIPKLGISETRMGMVYSAFLIAYSIAMLPGGWLIDRIGSARALTLYALLMGTFVCMTGMIGWITTHPESLLLCLLVIRSLAGVSSAPLHPGAAHVVSGLFSGHGRTTANGIVTAGALIGIAICYPLLGWLMDHMTWQLAVVISGMTFIAYGLMWRVITERKLTVASNSTPVESASSPMALETQWSLFKNRDMWLVALSYAAYGYFQYLFFYWMSYYFNTILHVPPVEARWASFWIMLSQAAGMAIGGLCTDFICRKLGTAIGRRAIVIFGMGMGACFGLLAINVSALDHVAICMSISMAALGICEGVFWTTATDIGRKSGGFAAAFMNTGGNVGGLISPVLTPVLAEQMGWTGAITFACTIAGAGGLVWFFIRPAKYLCSSIEIPNPQESS